ncbi:MAG: TIGR01777 family oxidoreductase [Acidobacteriota bacterium]
MAISGASGLVGRRTTQLLQESGWRVSPMVRRSSRAPGAIPWDPARGTLDAADLEGLAGVIHLAGENVAERWSAAKKKRILDSRVLGTRLIAERMAALDEPPPVLVCASAIGVYGDRGDAWMSEESSGGEGFLADVTRRWEEAAQAARDAGIRVVHARIGVVLSARGGALVKMLPPFKMGVGGRLGSGRQWFSWIHLDDVAAILQLALENPDLEGPINVVAPTPVRNSELTAALGRALRRPTLFPVPKAALKIGFGEMAEETLLASTRVQPRVLEERGYEFRYADLDEALRQELD